MTPATLTLHLRSSACDSISQYLIKVTYTFSGLIGKERRWSEVKTILMLKWVGLSLRRRRPHAPRETRKGVQQSPSPAVLCPAGHLEPAGETWKSTITRFHPTRMKPESLGLELRLLRVFTAPWRLPHAASLSSNSLTGLTGI